MTTTPTTDEPTEAEPAEADMGVAPGPTQAEPVIAGSESTDPDSTHPDRIDPDSPDPDSTAVALMTRFDRWVPFVLVLVLTVLWAALFSVLIWRRHHHFGTFSFDLSLYDQGIWLLSEGTSPFITNRGLHFFGTHSNLATFIYLPAYWLGGGAHVLNVSQALSMAAGAIPVYLIARDRLESTWFALTLGIIYLLNPTVQWLVWESFHPDSMAMLPLLYAIWFGLNERWKPMAGALLVALLWKEDVALAVVMFGIYLMVTNRNARKVGLGVMAGGIAFWQITGKLVIGHYNNGAAFYATWFGDLGSSPSEIAKTAITNPTKVIPKFQDPTATEYTWELLRPFGFMALLAPWVLLIAAPQIFVNTIANQTFFRNYQAHYAAVPVVAIIWAFIEGVRLWGWKPQLRAGLIGAALICSVWSTYYSGITPWSVNAYTWAPNKGPSWENQRAAVDMVPAEARVSAIYNLNAHLAHRVHIYDWPNPWIPRNWGNDVIAGVPDPGIIEYIVLDRTLLGDTEPLFVELMNGGDFEIVYDEGNQLVAKRVAGMVDPVE